METVEEEQLEHVVGLGNNKAKIKIWPKQKRYRFCCMTTRVLKERTRVTTHLYNLPMLMGMRMIRMNGERFIYPPMPFMTHQTTNHRAPTILTTAS